jgi:DNA-binding Lrp family transcriptional regulator
MGKESYKLLLKLKNDQEQKNRLLQFSKQNKNIIYFLELMGKYDADLEIEIENREKLQELIIEIRNEFPFIEDYEIMPLFYDLGSDFYPAEKK